MKILLLNYMLSVLKQEWRLFDLLISFFSPLGLTSLLNSENWVIKICEKLNAPVYL